MSFSFAELISYFGGFLGFLLAVVVFIYSKGKRSIRFSLASVLILSSLIVILGTLNYSGKIIRIPFLLRIDSPIHYLLGPAFYFYTLSSLRKDFRFRSIHLIHLLPFIINLIEFIPFYLVSDNEKLNYYIGFMEKGSIVIAHQYLLKTISVWGYLIAQLFLLFRYLDKSNRQKTYDKHLVAWFAIYLSGQFLGNTGLLIDHLTGLKLFEDPYRFAMSMVTFILYSIALALIFFPRLLYGNIFDNKLLREKYGYSNLTEAEKSRILNRWLAYVTEKSKPYLNPRLTLSEVAEILNTNSQRLSQVINEKTGMNFNDYINKLRVEEAKILLTGSDYNNLTIDAIAMKSGFNSKSPFYTSFKKFTGMTPRQFIKNS